MGSRSGLGSTGDFFHGFHLQLRTRSVFVTSSRLFRGNQFASKGILEIFTDDSDSVSIFRFLIKENIAERKVQPLRVSKCSTSGLFTLHLLFRLLPNAVCCNYIPREPHTIFFPLRVFTAAGPASKQSEKSELWCQRFSMHEIMYSIQPQVISHSSHGSTQLL